MTFLSELLNRAQAKNEKANLTYSEVLQAVALGKNPPLEAVEMVLASSGKSAEDFAFDVQRQIERSKLQALADTAEEVQRQLSEAGQARKLELESEKSELAELTKKHEQSRLAFGIKYGAIENKMRAVREAKQMLAQLNAPPPPPKPEFTVHQMGTEPVDWERKAASGKVGLIAVEMDN